MKTYPVTIVEIGTVALGQEAMLRAAQVQLASMRHADAF